MLKIDFDHSDDDERLSDDDDDGLIHLDLNGGDFVIDLGFQGGSSKSKSGSRSRSRSKSKSSVSSSHPRMISEGSYGCVHAPALKCLPSSSSSSSASVSSKPDASVSKIMREKHAITEMKQYQIIDEIDPNLKYHLASPSRCDPDPTSKSNLKAIEKCSEGQKMVKHLSAYNLLVMDYGGENWAEFSVRMAQERKSKTATKQMIDFWKEAQRIFDGVHLFDKNGILHHDLKPQNLVYKGYKGEEKGSTGTDKQQSPAARANFIDFGLMQYKADLIKKSYESNNQLAEYHWSFPFEIEFLNFDHYLEIIQLGDHDIQYHTRRFVELSVENKNFIQPNMISFFRYIGIGVTDNFDHIAEKFAKTLSTFTRKSATGPTKISSSSSSSSTETSSMYQSKKKKNQLYEEFVRRCIDTVDIYGLGLSCKKVLNDTRKHIDESLAEKMDRLFDQMTSADLLERSSLDAEGYATKYRRIIEEGMGWV